MIKYNFGAVLVAGALLFGCVQAQAASPITNGFIANVAPNVDFLDRSSRLALDNSKTARLRDFARSQAREQTLAANEIDGWIEGTKATTVVAASEGGGALLTGRSVAVDGQRGQVVDTRLPMGQEDLDRLEGLTGAEFDALYKEKQLDALHQVETDYVDYIAKGDDPTLLAMAGRELPKVRKRMAVISKM